MEKICVCGHFEDKHDMFGCVWCGDKCVLFQVRKTDA